MSRKIEDLAPEARSIAYPAIDELERQGIPYWVSATLRTMLQQVASWAQGRGSFELVNLLRRIAGMLPIARRENDYTITECNGVDVRSRHQSGLAIDIAALDENGSPTWDYRGHLEQYKAIAVVMRAAGFESGQDWMTKPDGSPSPYADVGLGWDPPHYEIRRTP